MAEISTGLPTGEITLAPRAPLEGRAREIICGDLVLEAGAPDAAALIVAKPGPRAPLSLALKAALGHGWPEPGEALGLPGEGARILWRGAREALVIDARPPAALAALTPLAHVIDMSDAFAALTLREHGRDGDTADALARLTPLDLRLKAFPPGRTARSLLHRIPAQITRLGETAFEILVPRSMAASAESELRGAMERCAARNAALGG